MTEHLKEEIKLTKSQRQLFLYWKDQVEGMSSQVMAMFNQLWKEIQMNMVVSFKEELLVDDHYIFDLSNLVFKLKKPEGQEPSKDEGGHDG